MKSSNRRVAQLLASVAATIATVMRSRSALTVVLSAATLLPVLWNAGNGCAADQPLTLHPHAVPLPFTREQLH